MEDSKETQKNKKMRVNKTKKIRRIKGIKKPRKRYGLTGLKSILSKFHPKSKVTSDMYLKRHKSEKRGFGGRNF